MRRALAIIVLATMAAAPPLATGSPLEKALDHLSARQDSLTGAIGPAGPGQAADTAWAAMAVAGTGEDPSAWHGAGLGLSDAVAALPGDAVGDVLRLSVAQRAAGLLDPAMADRVAAQRSADGSFPGGTAVTAWGVMALIAAAVPPDDPRVTGAVSILRSLQLPDGGWAATGAPQSDVVTTATVMQALRAARVGVGDPVLVAARARLLSLRDSGGTFARAAVPTAWAVLAIRALGERPDRGVWASGGSPLVALEGLQRADGGVRAASGQPTSLFATSLAALAWSGRTLPTIPRGRRVPGRAPRIVARTPADRDVVRGVLSIRYSDETGGTGIDPARTTITVNGVDMTRRARITPYTLQIRASALPKGTLALQARVRDRAGHSITADWSVIGAG